MSAIRDTDQIISAWLDQMPDRVSDRVVSSVLQAVVATPQVRRPFAGRLWRPTFVNRLVWIAAAAVVAVLVAGGGLFFLGNRNAPGAPITTPTPAPTALITPDATDEAGGAVPSQLQARWMGSTRDFVTSGAGVSMSLGPSSFAFYQSNDDKQERYSGSVAPTGAGQLSFNDDACTASAVPPGKYGWTVSPSGRVLTLTLVDDQCATRSTRIPGTYWLMGCIDPNTDCLGDLDAGTYSSQYIRPVEAAPWAPLFGAVTYTVPDGWANYADWPGWLGLTTSQSFANTTPRDPLAAMSVDVYAQANNLMDPCSDVAANSQSTAQELLTTLPNNVTASVPKAITIDGLAGYYVDVDPVSSTASSAPSASSDACVNGGSYFFGGGGGQGLDPGERNRLIALDQPDGNVLTIMIRSQASDLTSLIEQAMPVIQSMHFK